MNIFPDCYKKSRGIIMFLGVVMWGEGSWVSNQCRCNQIRGEWGARGNQPSCQWGHPPITIHPTSHIHPVMGLYKQLNSPNGSFGLSIGYYTLKTPAEHYQDPKKTNIDLMFRPCDQTSHESLFRQSANKSLIDKHIS